MKSFLKILKDLGPVRLGMIASVAIVLLGSILWAVMRVNAPQMALLYGNVELAEGAQVINKLEEMGVPFQVRGDGTHIFVPIDQVLRLRMVLAESGLPNCSKMVGYEVFDRSDILGTTSFIQDLNLLRALEGELSRTICSIHGIAGARVHIVMPRRELFSRDKREPTASILLKMKGGASLSKGQVQSIQHLVSTAVPGLSTEQISILDNHGSLLARGDKDGGGSGFSRMEEARVAYEARLSRMLENLLGRSVGFDKVRAEVSVILDTDRLTEQTENYDPDGQVIRSTHNSSDIESAQDGSIPTTLTNNLPNAAVPATGASGPQRSGKKTEEVVNYEVSKKVVTRVKEWGGIQSLSVAVMVDGSYELNAEGEPVYRPRSEDEMTEFRKLVQTAVGFREDRGDKLEIINLRFVPQEDNIIQPSSLIWGFERASLLKVVENLGLGLIVFLILLFVARPLVNRFVDRKLLSHQVAGGVPSAATSAPPGVAPVGVAPQSPGPGKAATLVPTVSSVGDVGVFDSELELSLDEDQDIDSDGLSKRRVSLLKRIESLIDKYPDDAAAVLRSWIKSY